MTNKWATNLKCDLAPACSYKDKLVEPMVFIPLDTYLAIRQLCKDIEVEWQMFLLGEVDGNCYNVTGYHIPKQVVTYASVEDEDNIPVAWYKENKVIGTLHSHGNMNVFFSGTDDINNQNSPVSLHVVVNNKDEYVACVRTTLPCGMEAFVKCGVTLEVPEKVEHKVIGFENIKKATVQPYAHQKNFAFGKTKGEVYLGLHPKTGESMWGTEEDLERLEMMDYNNSFGHINDVDFPTIEQINKAVEDDEKYYKSKKGKKKGLYPWCDQ